MDSNPAGLAALSEEYTLGEHPTHRRMTPGRQTEEAATCKLSRLRRNQLCSALILDLQPPKPQRTKLPVLEPASLWYSAQKHGSCFRGGSRELPNGQPGPLVLSPPQQAWGSRAGQTAHGGRVKETIGRHTTSRRPQRSRTRQQFLQEQSTGLCSGTLHEKVHAPVEGTSCPYRQ